ncbi:MAG TPA: hypothetical protein VGI16_13380 [Candidatus Acidoferrum sp.]
MDYLLGVVAVVPWRCRKCEARFYARPLPLNHLLYAHCSICGNLELQRISAEYVRGWFAFLWRWLHLPAFRCGPCRHKFFSVRPVRRGEAQVATSSMD